MTPCHLFYEFQFQMYRYRCGYRDRYTYDSYRNTKTDFAFSLKLKQRVKETNENGYDFFWYRNFQGASPSNSHWEHSNRWYKQKSLTDSNESHRVAQLCSLLPDMKVTESITAKCTDMNSRRGTFLEAHWTWSKNAATYFSERLHCSHEHSCMQQNKKHH